MRITDDQLRKLVETGKACVADGIDAMRDNVSSRALGEMAEELLQLRPGLKALAGLQHLRKLALGGNETRNPDLPRSQLAELEAALDWLDSVQQRAR